MQIRKQSVFKIGAPLYSCYDHL